MCLGLKVKVDYFIIIGAFQNVFPVLVILPTMASAGFTFGMETAPIMWGDRNLVGKMAKCGVPALGAS